MHFAERRRGYEQAARVGDMRLAMAADGKVVERRTQEMITGEPA